MGTFGGYTLSVQDLGTAPVYSIFIMRLDLYIKTLDFIRMTHKMSDVPIFDMRLYILEGQIRFVYTCGPDIYVCMYTANLHMCVYVCMYVYPKSMYLCMCV